mgnify:CR=1 FL=1
MDKEPAGREQGSPVTVFKCGPEQYIVLEYTSKGLPVFCTVHRKTESLIKADIWERGFPAILTSGTLKAGESFQRSEQLNGLEDVGRVREYQLITVRL